MLEGALPQYMSYGMTPDEYWNGDCTLARAYYKAYKIKAEHENEMLWIQGAYFYDALVKASPFYHDLPHKGLKPQAYIDKPFDLFGNAKPKQRSQQEIAEEARAVMMAKIRRLEEEEKLRKGGDE